MWSVLLTEHSEDALSLSSFILSYAFVHSIVHRLHVSDVQNESDAERTWLFREDLILPVVFDKFIAELPVTKWWGKRFDKALEHCITAI